MGNLLGLIPGIYTFTSQITITLSLALIVFISVIWLVSKDKDYRFLKYSYLKHAFTNHAFHHTPLKFVSFVYKAYKFMFEIMYQYDCRAYDV